MSIKSLRSLALAAVAVSMLGGCVAGVIVPVPAGSSSSSASDKQR
jgi:hypothetical protein